MADKKQELVTKYLADQLALEGHIAQAIDKQIKATQDEPDVNPTLVSIYNRLDQHVSQLKARLEALGGKPNSPVKEAGAAVLGVAAGVVDKLRSEEVSKDFRDNYTAISLSIISLEMLNTTALACNDTQTAELTKRLMRENAQIVMEIGHLVPGVVVRDLSDLTDLNPSAAADARKAYQAAWQPNSAGSTK